MDSKRKRKSLSIAEKQKLIEEVKKGLKSKKAIAAEFGIPIDTLSTILKCEGRIMEATPGAIADKKRLREAMFPDIEECLMKWFQQCADNYVSLGGPKFKEKAEMFAKLLGHNNFKASNGWFDKFKKRYGIVFQKSCGESGSVSGNVCNALVIELHELLDDYEPHNIFNAGETALFYKCLPDNITTFKDEKCHGGKHSKERVTVLLATNMVGTEKLKPLMIGKYKNPKSLVGCKSFPVDYFADELAWMSTELFTEWLVTIDKKMTREKRKILLFIDSCTAHNVIPPLQSVQVKFLPPNTTSKLQPLNQGIVKNFKTLYRKEVVRKIILDMQDEKPTSINMLQAMRMVDKSWRNVDKKTIVDCFKTCGFWFGVEDGELDKVPVMVTSNLEADWNAVVPHLNVTNTSFDDFVNFDNDVAVTVGLMTDMEIVESFREPKGNEQDDAENDEEPSADPPVSSKQARAAVMMLRTYLEQSTGVADNAFSAIVTIENEIEMRTTYTVHQSKTTDHFT